MVEDTHPDLRRFIPGTGSSPVAASASETSAKASITPAWAY